MQGKNNLISDFDNAIHPGKTYYGNNTTLHRPTNDVHFYYCMVFGYGDNHVLQIAHITNINNSPLYYRTCDGSTWSDWKKYITNSDLLTNNRFGISMATVSDCNLLTENGIYIANNIANRPADSISIIIVFTYDSNIIQIGINVMQKYSPFIRRRNSGTWSEWASV